MPDVTSQPGGEGTRRTATGPAQSTDRNGENCEPPQGEQESSRSG